MLGILREKPIKKTLYFLVSCFLLGTLLFSFPYFLTFPLGRFLLEKKLSQTLKGQVHLADLELNWKKESQKIKGVMLHWKEGEIFAEEIIWRGRWFSPLLRKEPLFFELKKIQYGVEKKKKKFCLASSQIKGTLCGFKAELEPFECLLNNKIPMRPQGMINIATQEVEMTLGISGASINRILKAPVFQKEEWVEIPLTGLLYELAYTGVSLWK